MALPQPGTEQRDATKFIVFENFERMNTQSVRQSLSEKELAWDENLQPIAPNNFVTVPAPATAALATISNTETITSIFYADINTVDYFVVFTLLGAGYLITIASGTINQFAPDGTFSTQPDVTTWQATRLLIADSKAGYTTFDGTLFIRQGGVSPNITVTNGGSGYGTAPTVTISGGSGTGATAVAVVSNGSIVAVNLINPGLGYQATDMLTVAFGTSPGSGAAGHVTMTGRSISSLSLLSGGAYVITPGNYALAFSGGGGTGAAGYAVVPSVGGIVTSVVLTSPGSGYTSLPTITVTGAIVTITPANIRANFGTESIATVVLDSGGTLYTAPPSVSVYPPDGLGSGGNIVSTESGGTVTSLALVASAVTTLAIAVQGISISTAGIYSLSFSGGGGTGAAGTVTIGNYTNNTGTTSLGVIASVLTSGGSGYTSAPTVSVSGASFSSSPTILAYTASQGFGYDTTPNLVIGSGSGATAIAHVWPFINSSIAAYAFTTLAVFQGRVWLGGGQLLTWTGTGATYGNVGYDDFLSADASGSLIISDADLIHAITALRSLNNYLFIMGDQSVKQIGNISLNTAGNVTLFTILTLSSDQGTIYPKSCISYNRVFMFANTNGIYGVFGSSVQKLSGDMDGIWKLVDFSQVPQGALADINAIHNAVFLIRYKDPLASTRSIMLAFDGKKWFVLSQGNGMTAFATSASLTTGQNSLYGSLTGQDITQLFAAPTVAVTFKWQSSLTHHGNAVQGKKIIRAGLALSLATGTGTITMTADSENGSQTATFNLVAGFQKPFKSIESSGHYLGQTVTGTLAGLTMTNMALEYQETALWV